MGVVIRAERTEDAAAVRAVNQAAFPTPAEAALADQLRAAGLARVSLLAEEAGRVVGHNLYSPVQVIGQATWPAVALGPMAVLPAHQRRGIGSMLVRAGQMAAAELGEGVVFVLGHPEFYPRFGFKPTKPAGITCEFEVPEPVFMVAELREGALIGRTGVVHYHEAFRSV
jgi:putative acetyltransferase